MSVRGWCRQHDGLQLVNSLSEPKPAAGEVVVAPTLVGLSAADLRVASGQIAFEGVIGREFVGRVKSWGSGVPSEARERLGASLVVGSPIIACGTCDMCMAGLASHCRDRRELGSRSLGGCLASAFVIPWENLTALPEGVEPDAGVMALAVAHARHVAQLAAPAARSHVTVLGDGVMALLSAQVLATACKGVRLLGTQASTFARSEKWGITHRHVEEAGRRQDQDVVVDAIGSAESLGLATRLARPRGTIVVCEEASGGASPASGSLDPAGIVENELRIVGARGGSVADSVAAIASGRVTTEGLVSARYSFDQVAAALAALRELNTLRVVIEFPEGA